MLSHRQDYQRTQKFILKDDEVSPHAHQFFGCANEIRLKLINFLRSSEDSRKNFLL